MTRASRPPASPAPQATPPTGAGEAHSGWDLSALHERAAEVAALLKALAHPDRLLLLCQLVETERSVGELGELAGLKQPSLSQQLGVLRAERLVATRREGKQKVYRIASPVVHAVLQTLHREFCQPTPGLAPAASHPAAHPLSPVRHKEPA